MKKIFLVAFLFVSTFSFLRAQTKTEVVTFAEQMPEYIGGDSARIIFFNNNLQYPDTARKNSIEARVQIQFVVGEDGNISDITPLTHKGWGFEEEAIRVIKLMPTWKPGMIDGKPVPVRFSMPFVFKLSKDGK